MRNSTQNRRMKGRVCMVDSGENTNWEKAVAGVVIVDGKVLLARHTYGGGKGKLIIPGGFVNVGETPENAVVREFLEETGIAVRPLEILGIRFNEHDWYVVFSVEYVGGVARSDEGENDEVIWLDIDEALMRDDVPELTKIFAAKAVAANNKLEHNNYAGGKKQTSYSLYC